MKPSHAPAVRPTWPRVRGVLAALTLAALSACGDQELYAKLDERQANEMVAVLQLAGIPANKTAAEGGYTVSAPQGEFARAVQTLRAMGLPREEFDSLGKVFKREGFVSTPLEERSRLIHALSQELSHTVSSIDGVVLARVTLVVPEKHPLSDKVVPSSASVLIKHRRGMDMESLVPKIRALVVNSVEGLPYDSVTVVPFAAEAWTPAPPSADVVPEGLRMALWGAGLVGVGSLAAAGAVALRRRPGVQAWPRALLAQRKAEASEALPR